MKHFTKIRCTNVFNTALVFKSSKDKKEIVFMILSGYILLVCIFRLPLIFDPEIGLKYTISVNIKFGNVNQINTGACFNK